MPRRLAKSAAAEEDLIDILTYSYKNWGVERGDRYFDALEKRIEEIAKEPEDGHQRDSVRPGYWSRLSQKHVIFYTFTDDEVRIRRVLHGRMNPRRHVHEGDDE